MIKGYLRITLLGSCLAFVSCGETDNCELTNNGDGTSTIYCPDGTQATFRDTDGDLRDENKKGHEENDDENHDDENHDDESHDDESHDDENHDESTGKPDGTSGDNYSSPIDADGTLHGSITIHDIRDVHFLRNVKEITGNLFIYPGLIEIHLPALERVRGSISISGGKRIEAPKLKAVDEGMTISSSRLENLRGFKNLQKVKGPLYIVNNDSLRSLEGLESLQAVEDSIQIANNRFLNSLKGLENLQHLEGLLQIIHNDLLCEDEALALANQLDKDIDSEVSILYNNGECP